MKKKALSALVLSTLLFTQAGAADLSAVLKPVREANSITSLDPETSQRIKDILSKKQGDYARPAACPMASTNYKDILAKINSIKGLFNNTDCIDDPTQLDALLGGVTSLKDEVEANASDLGLSGTLQSVEPKEPIEVNGQSLNEVFSSVNTLFFKSKCHVKDQGIFNRSADIIQNFSQMGMLVPNSNGLVIAGGGLALSSILRLIGSLFEKQFQFDKKEDRQNFIKLNCAFYDIRRDIESSGMLDIALPEDKAALAEVVALVKKIEARKKVIVENQKKIVKEIDSKLSTHVASEMGVMSNLDKDLTTGLKSLNRAIKDEGVKPAQTVQKEIIMGLVRLNQSLTKNLALYNEFAKERETIFDADFAQNLKSLNSLSYLFKMDKEKFDSKVRSGLLFHFERLQAEIAGFKTKYTAAYVKETTIDGLSIAKYKEKLKKEVEASLKDLNGHTKALNPIKVRLDRVLKNDRSFTGTDSGSENKAEILSDYENVAEQVYGKWGYEFLKYTTQTSKKINDNFEKKFKKFAKNHLKEDSETRRITVQNVKDVPEMRVMFACQDAKPFKKKWATADAIINQGYDFVATNKELFHSDTSKTFLKKAVGGSSKYERIQDHHKSSIFAKKLLTGKPVSEKDKNKYLGRRAQKKKYLGTIMLDVTRSKPRAQLIQRLENDYDCSKVVTEDK